MGKPLVFLGMPTYDGNCSVGAAEAFYVTTTRGGCDVVRQWRSSSFLTKVFNDLWCTALTHRARGVTHFAMMHADVVPQTVFWLDVLLGELVRLDADVVSAVVPIKTQDGLTSTGLQVEPGDPWVRRRLSMTEVFDLPETFGPDDVGHPLLLNTGLWVCRLDRPWCERVCFDVFNRLVCHDDGDRSAQAVPEDWLFSATLNDLGCRLYATRKVVVTHRGAGEFSNGHPWGTQKTDEVYQRIAEARGKANAVDQVHAAAPG